ncbi:MAG: TIGR03435 family protein [Myxococcota bacterium]
MAERRSLVGVRALAFASFFAAAACGSSDAREGGVCARDAAAALARGEVRIERIGGSTSATSAARGLVRAEARTGTLARLGLTLDEHLAIAWGLASDELDVAAALEPGVFDVCARPDDARTATAEAMIRAALERRLGVEVRHGKRTGPVLALRLRARGLVPTPVEARDAAAASDRVARAGAFRVRAAPISELVAFLAPMSPLPVVDETGLDARYDLDLEWDPSTGARGLRAALADAGFELVRARRTLPRWTARAAR